MLDFKSVMSGALVPAVAAGDVRRVWEFVTTANLPVPPVGGTNPEPGSTGAETIGFHVRLIAQQCAERSDPIAVFVRVALVQMLLQSGLLDGCREGGRPHDAVFAAIAAFPLPEGAQNLRPEEFASALRKRL